MADNNKSATLTIEGEEYNLPIYSPTAGPDVIDIRKLYAQAGVFTYDPGYTSTASCESTITFIDGEKGELFRRGLADRMGSIYRIAAATCSAAFSTIVGRSVNPASSSRL